jgi:hypothetical protein
MPYLSPKILEALEFAAIAHKGQFRKFPANVPYISHLLAVAHILHAADYAEEVITAGLLHDVLEDTPFKAEDIQQRFGDRVLELVVGVTEQKSLPWAERKEKYLKQLETADMEIKAISAADLLSNRLSNLLGLRRGENPWVKFSKNPAEYSKRIFDIDRRRMEIIKQGANIPFMEELERVAKEVEDITQELINHPSPN